MEEKSHVGLQLCFICRKESTAVLLDRRLKQTLTSHEIGMDVCDKCEKKYLAKGKGVLMMEATKQTYGFQGNKERIMPTGNFTVIKESAFKRIFKDYENKADVLIKRRLFVEPEVFLRFCPVQKEKPFVKGKEANEIQWKKD